MKMSKVLSLDIETKNLSNEIGGWHNQHMFKVACAVTWDGKKGVVYTDAPLTDTLTKSEGLEFVCRRLGNRKTLKNLRKTIDFEKNWVDPKRRP